MNGFYYEQLDQNGQKYYDEVIKGLKNNWHEITLYGLKDSDVLMKCIEAIKYDFVELFYIDFGRITWRSHKDFLEYIPAYIYDGEERIQHIEKIRDIALDIVDRVPQKKSIYDKCLCIHNFIVRNCEYNYDAIKEDANVKSAYSIEGVFLEKKAVCQGVAMAYRYLCNMLGIDSIVARGNSLKPGNKNYERHAWNIVRVADAAIHIDTTWDMCLTKNGEPIRYDYFFLPDIEMMRDHQYVKYPICRNRKISMFHYTNTCFDSIEDLKNYIDMEGISISKKEFFLHFKMKNRKEDKKEVGSILSDYIMKKVNKSFSYSYSVNEAQSVFMFHFIYQ